MTEQTGWLTTLTVDWDGLQDLGMSEWLWADTERPGLHCAATLPGVAPGQVSHVWGWAPGRWVRLRIDPDLATGVAGALLTEQNPVGGGAKEVHIDKAASALWPATAGQVAVQAIPGLTDGSRYAVVRTAYVTSEGGTGGDLVPATFIELVAGRAPADGSEP